MHWWGRSNEYCLRAELRKLMYTPVNPSFFYMKVGFKGEGQNYIGMFLWCMVFIFLHRNICCDYSLEAPQRGTFNVSTHNICFQILIWILCLILDLLNPDMPYLYKQCSSRSAGFLRSQLIWICTYFCNYVNLYQQLPVSGSRNLIGWKIEVGMASKYIQHGKG